MKIKKRVLCPHRLRQVPEQFSWIDQRLVRQGDYLGRCSPGALALYLILVTVCDAEGLSYYSDSTLQKMLGLNPGQLSQARGQLCQAELIAYQHPLYQVLSLEKAPSEGSRVNRTLSAGEILRQITGGQR